MKRILAVSLILVMLLSLVACTPKTTETATGEETTKATTQAPAATTTQAAETTEPEDEGDYVLAELGEMPLISSGEYVLTIGLPQNVQVTDYYDNYLTKFLQERSGLTFEFFFFPSGVEARQKLELMVSSGQDLPEIVTAVDVGSLGKLNYGKQGVYLALNDYLETDNYWLNKSADLYLDDQERSDMITFYTSPDGNMYQFPFVYADPTDELAYSLWINTAWLELLDLDMPVTTDDFYDVLTAFIENDPNENGKRDEIPFVGSTAWVSDPTFCILNAFVYFSPYRLNVDDGVVSAPFITDGYRDGVRYMNKLISEDLMSPLSFTQDAESHKAMLDLQPDQDTLVGVFTGHPKTKFAVDSEKRMEFNSLPPLTGPEGVCYAPLERRGYDSSVHITKYAKDPQLVFRFLDMMCETSNSLSVRFGVEDEDWRYADADETPRFDYYAPPVYWTSNLHWGTENNTIWNTNPFNFLPKSLFGSTVRRTYDNPYTEFREHNWDDSIAERVGKQPDEIVTILIFTAEEQEEIDDLKTNIDAYEAENRVLFATGERDPEKDWDSYLAELDAMGIERYIEIVQQCYDRMYK